MIAAGAGYLPALAPANAAMVRVKIPSAGPSITIAFRQTSFTVAETAGTTSYGVRLTTGALVARPRVPVAYLVRTQDNTATAAAGLCRGCYPGRGWARRFGRQTARASWHTRHRVSRLLTTPCTKAASTSHCKYKPDTTVLLCASESSADNACEATVRIIDNEILGITRIAITSMPATLPYDVASTITFTVTFNGPVTVATTDGTPTFAFNLGGASRTVDYTQGSGSSQLLFVYTVRDGDHAPDGIAWPANGLRLNGSTIRFASTAPSEPIDALVDHAAQFTPLSEHQVDTTPQLLTATIDGAILRLEYNEPLIPSLIPTTMVFSIVADGSMANPADIAINGNTVTLTMATPCDHESERGTQLRAD